MRVDELRRYPIKSMLGETPDAVTLKPSGVEGDRVMALVDAETDKVVSAKDPRRWAALLGCRASYIPGERPAAGVTMPDGTTIRSDDPGFDTAVSALLGRAVRLSGTPAEAASYDDVWPDIDGLAPPASSRPPEPTPPPPARRSAPCRWGCWPPAPSRTWRR
ncbi:MAG TPA: MOSC N-terminal beta barrel domain-containing protein [Acidimicrobiales bacterium]|nr:MOSC N-terminal beta barrel domain-containing protein [Acidimicrobiales bacterium]